MSDTQPIDISPFDGGPYADVLRRLHLPASYTVSATARRIAVAVFVAWLPLVLLSALRGHAVGPSPRQALLCDVATYARYLLAVPLLLLAEPLCLPALARILHRFREGGFVTPADETTYEAILASTRRLLNARAAAVVIAALAYVQALLASHALFPEFGDTWRSQTADSGPVLTPAGWWLALVSVPLFLFVLYGWLWRLFLWARCLFGISRLDLQLLPTHPDLNGGIGFVGGSLRVLSLVAFAVGCVPAGAVGRLVLFDGRNALDFKYPVGGLVVLVVLILVGPLLFLYPSLCRARTRGVLEYGRLASAVGRRLHQKWIKEERSHADRSVLEVSDFSATTDLFQIVERVQGIRMVPFKIKGVGRMVAAALLPFAPVLLAEVPAKQILEAMAKLVF
jgi:hypothetical protein